MSDQYEAIVLGGGPGGYVCAIRLAQLGVKTVCIEEEEYGGVCLKWGCIPSKALIANAHFVEKARHISDSGITVSDVKVDVDKMQDWKGGVVKKMTSGVRSLLKANGGEMIEGRGKVVDAKSVEVTLKSGEKKLEKRGGKVLKNTRAERLEKTESGVTVIVSSDGKEQRIEADVVLVAVGMKPRSRGVGLEEIGVEIDQRGFVKTNEFCETNIKGVYAIGDVSGQPMLAHKASKEGEVAAEVIAGHHAAKDWVTVPGIIFTDPEIATAGLTEAQAKEQGYAIKAGKFPFAALGRAVSIGETDGFVKVVTDTKSGRILGIHIA